METASEVHRGTAAPLVAQRHPLQTVDGRLTRLGRFAIVVVSVAVFLTALDQTVVVTALISMLNDIGVSVTQPDRAAWIVSGYLLGYVVAMPLMGRVSDVYGRWRVFALCLVTFGLGSLLCALSPILGGAIAPDISTLTGLLLTPFYDAAQWLVNVLGHVGLDSSSPALDLLVGARVLQAIGGGALVPVAMAVVGDLVGGERRGLALGLVGAVTEAGGVLGPLWGAWVTSVWGWQWIFYLNVPLAVLLLVAGYVALPRNRGARERVDIAGALLFGAALTCLTLGLGQQTGATGALSIGASVHWNPRLVAASFALLLVFVLVQTRLRHPVVPPALFRSAAFSAAALLSLIVGVALIVALVEIPLFIGTLVTNSPIEAGLALLRMTALIPVGALAGGWLTARFGCRLSACLGVACVVLGFWLMHLWPASVGWGQMTLAAVVTGFGFGLVIAPISTSALNAVPAAQAGVASAVVTALRMSGMILGLAGLTSWGLARFQSLMAPHHLPGTAGGETAAAYSAALNLSLHQVYSEIFAVTAGIALVGLLPALLLWNTAPDTRGTATGIESYVAPLG